MTLTLQDLQTRLAQRAKAPPDRSYTASLIAKGPAACARKLGEEAIETVIAAIEDDRAALVSESADLLYHLLVLWQAKGITLEQVMDELESRTAQSGHAEKAARS